MDPVGTEEVNDLVAQLELLSHTIMQCQGSTDEWSLEDSVTSLLTRIFERIEAEYKQLERSDTAATFSQMRRTLSKVSGTCSSMSEEFLLTAKTVVDALGDDAELQRDWSEVKEVFASIEEQALQLSSISRSEESGALASNEEGETRILVVEDNLVNRKVLGGMLKKHGHCDFASDGSEGLFQFLIALEEGEPYDLIFLDILMPNMDGRKLLRLIRLYEQERSIRGLDGVKVIMTTCLDDSGNVLGSFREGCEAYLTKPILREKFEEVVSKFLG
jgi:two-component system chemotaxis response regulator CheY